MCIGKRGVRGIRKTILQETKRMLENECVDVLVWVYVSISPRGAGNEKEEYSTLQWSVCVCVCVCVFVSVCVGLTVVVVIMCRSSAVLLCARVECGGERVVCVVCV